MVVTSSSPAMLRRNDSVPTSLIRAPHDRESKLSAIGTTRPGGGGLETNLPAGARGDKIVGGAE